MEARFEKIQQEMRVSPTPSPMPDIFATQASGSGIRLYGENNPDGVLGAGRPSDRIQGSAPAAQFGSQEAPVGSLQGVGIPPPSDLGTGPAERDREFARTDCVVEDDRKNEIIEDHIGFSDSKQESSPSSLQIHYEISMPKFIDFLQEPLKVNSDSLEVEASDVASDKMGTFDLSVESTEVCLGDFKVDSLELLANQSAQQVFVEMPIRGSNISVPDLVQGNRVFDPGIAEGLDYMSNGLSKKVEIPLQTLVMIVFDPRILHELELQVALTGGYWVLAGLLILVFDPGIVSKGDDRNKFMMQFEDSCVAFVEVLLKFFFWVVEQLQSPTTIPFIQLLLFAVVSA